jgi:hypothetical protein
VPTGPVAPDEPQTEHVPWHGALAWSTSNTAILFGTAGRTSLDQQSVAIAAGRSLGSWALRGVVGVVTQARLGTTQSLGNGWLAGLAASRRLLPQAGARPDLGLSLALAVASRTLVGTQAESASLTSADVRAGLEAGWQLGPVHVHALGRLFGGPVWWARPGQATDLGGDRTHFQLGAGLSGALGPVLLFAEGVPLGEQGVAVGLGL